MSFNIDAVEDVKTVNGKIVYYLPIASNPRYGRRPGLIWTLVLRHARTIPDAYERIGVTRSVFMEELDESAPEREIIIV
jgi:hypothetical protein